MQQIEVKLAPRSLKEHLKDLSFWVAFITLLAVLYYACLTRRILIADTRPVVAIRAFIKSCPENVENAGAACALVQNFGRSTAMARVRKRASFSDTQLPKGPDLPDEQQHMIIPPGDVGNRIDFDAAVTTDKKGFWYLTGLIEYGGGYGAVTTRGFAASSRFNRPSPSRNMNAKTKPLTTQNSATSGHGDHFPAGKLLAGPEGHAEA